MVAGRIATPPPPTGGGLRSYRIAPTLAVECSTSYTAVAHPSDDRKDADESGGRGGTRHHRGGDCDDVAGYRLRHISRGCDQDYDYDDDDDKPVTQPCRASGIVVPLLCCRFTATALLRRHSASDLCPPVANCKYLLFPIIDSMSMRITNNIPDLLRFF